MGPEFSLSVPGSRNYAWRVLAASGKDALLSLALAVSIPRFSLLNP